MIPFAIVGSEKNVVIDGKSVRGRRNRWGVINGKFKIYLNCLNSYHYLLLILNVYIILVENEDHCEFVHLRDFLTR
jgi:septin family protein